MFTEIEGMNKLATILLGLVLLTYGLPSFAAEQGGSNLETKIVDAIEKEKVFSGEHIVSAKMDGSVAIVSTYLQKESKNIEQDCKINATLMAKALMISNDLSIIRLVVRFFSAANPSHYEEVVVTKAEAKALAEGAVSNEEFLASLRISSKTENEVTSPEKSNALDENKNSTATGSGTETSTGTNSAINSGASSTESKSGSSEVVASANASKGTSSIKKENKKPRYTSDDGLSFNIPPSWTVDDDVVHKDGMLLQLKSKQAKYANCITISRLPASKKPVVYVQEERKKFDYEGVKVERYEQSKYGEGGYPGAFIVLTYPHEWQLDYYEMNCLFTAGGFVYKLRGWCPRPDYRVIAPAFWEVMNSILVESSKAPSKVSAPAAGRAATNKGAAAGTQTKKH